MSHSIPPSFTFQAPPGWVPSLSTTPRQPSDDPILPAELMSMVIKELTDDHSLGTLAKLQSTSRAMYNMVTPSLYQHIIIDQRQAVHLFRLFEAYPRSDNAWFLHPTPPDPSIHLINVHIAQRLRFFFSNTQTLSLKTTRRSDSLDYGDTEERLARYNDLQTGLITFNGPTLWPKLEKCEWFLRPWPIQEDYNTELDSGEDEVLIESIFARLHPNQLVIQIPEFLKPYKRLYYDLSSCAKHLRADHIHFFDYVIGTRGPTPRASYSLTVHFRDCRAEELVGRDEDENGLHAISEESLVAFFDPPEPFIDIRELKLIGVPSTLACPLIENPSTHDELLQDLAYYLVDDIMDVRLKHRNFNDLKITIQSDSSPEGEATAVSRIFKLPWRP